MLRLDILAGSRLRVNVAVFFARGLDDAAFVGGIAQHDDVGIIIQLG
ncbi:hypothetical protein SH139x_003845 [Planctomycetaceae bacterium SH139]